MNQVKNLSGFYWNNFNELFETLSRVSFCASISTLVSQRADTFFISKWSCKILWAIKTEIFNSLAIKGLVTRRSSTTIFSNFSNIPRATDVEEWPKRRPSLTVVLPRLSSAHHQITVEYSGIVSPVICLVIRQKLVPR